MDCPVTAGSAGNQSAAPYCEYVAAFMIPLLSVACYGFDQCKHQYNGGQYDHYDLKVRHTHHLPSMCPAGATVTLHLPVCRRCRWHF